MNDLDEMQGLTADMVREWLRTQEPRIYLAKPADGEMWPPAEWTWRDTGETVRDRHMEQCLLDRLRGIANRENLSLQSLLRQMNPRLIPWPSDALIEAHRKDGGLWICTYGRGLSVGSFDGARFESSAVQMTRDAMDRLGARFWPVDAAGNKVRLPEVGR